MATTVKRLTYNDLEAIPLEHDGDRQEIIDGELVVTPSPMPKHQIVSRSIFRRLDQHVVANDLGEIFYASIAFGSPPTTYSSPTSSSLRRNACTSWAREPSTRRPIWWWKSCPPARAAAI
jgi:Uma2 family endonuclease